MVKRYDGELWYCCPRCGKKLFIVLPDAVCRGVFLKCKGVRKDGNKCGWSGEMII